MPDFQLRPDLDLTILIPARAGSKRCPGKNTRMLNGKPLIQWTIEAATAIGCPVIVSTDDSRVAAVAAGCRLHERHPDHATDTAPDFLWVNDLKAMITTRYFAICRPTSPFRTASTIRRGYAALVGSGAHSIRAISKVAGQHPGKMWRMIPESTLMEPIMGGMIGSTPFHSCPTQILPEVYVQNASLEIAQTWVIDNTETISGWRVAPFLTDPLESVNIDTEADFAEADAIASRLR